MKAGDMTDGIFLVHIVDALQETIDFTRDQSLEAFLNSTLLVRAVTSSFEIAGEATKNLTKEFRDVCRGACNPLNLPRAKSDS